LNLAYHASMLADTDRVEAYRRAIAAVVRPGDVVVDLGAGTGLLSVFAARAGARRVFAVEVAEIGDAAKSLVAAHRQIEVIRGRAEEVTLPERADVIVTETLGNYLLEEDIERIVLSARSRLGKPGAREIPRALALSAVPIELPAALRRRVELDPIDGFDVARLSRALQCQPLDARAHELDEALALAPAAELWRAPVGAAPPRSTASFTLARAGQLCGLALVIGAELAPGTELRTRLGRASNWTIPVLPVAGMPTLEAGDCVDTTFEVDRTGVVAWSASWSRAGKRLGETLQARALQRHLLGAPPPPAPTLRERVRGRLRRLL
jgi:hypothetical protein